MKVLIVSYVDGITEEITNVIKQAHSDAEIDVVKDTRSAEHNLVLKPDYYDTIVIDTMVQKYNGRCIAPILKPALDFLELIKSLDRIKTPEKVFALFDPDETGDRGKDEVTKMGFEMADYNFMSVEWRNKLYKYLSPLG